MDRNLVTNQPRHHDDPREDSVDGLGAVAGVRDATVDAQPSHFALDMEGPPRYFLTLMM